MNTFNKDIFIERNDALEHNTRLNAALREILAECDEAPTDNNAWVVAIQEIAREALAETTG